MNIQIQRTLETQKISSDPKSQKSAGALMTPVLRIRPYTRANSFYLARTVENESCVIFINKPLSRIENTPGTPIVLIVVVGVKHRDRYRRRWMDGWIYPPARYTRAEVPLAQILRKKKRDKKKTIKRKDSTRNCIKRDTTDTQYFPLGIGKRSGRGRKKREKKVSRLESRAASVDPLSRAIFWITTR